jgi:hypothetical protein
MTLWLVMAAIFTHALLPTGSPVQRSAGSAFSASTIDVTTIPRRDADTQDPRLEGAGDARAGTAPPDRPSEAFVVLPAAVSARLPRIGLDFARLLDFPEHQLQASPYRARGPPLALHLA